MSSFWSCESNVSFPIINRLVPSPSKYEIWPWSFKNNGNFFSSYVCLTVSIFPQIFLAVKNFSKARKVSEPVCFLIFFYIRLLIVLESEHLRLAFKALWSLGLTIEEIKMPWSHNEKWWPVELSCKPSSLVTCIYVSLLEFKGSLIYWQRKCNALHPKIM